MRTCFNKRESKEKNNLNRCLILSRQNCHQPTFKRSSNYDLRHKLIIMMYQLIINSILTPVIVLRRKEFNQLIIEILQQQQCWRRQVLLLHCQNTKSILDLIFLIKLIDTYQSSKKIMLNSKNSSSTS